MKWLIIIFALAVMPGFFLLGDMLGRRSNRARIAGFASAILFLLFYIFISYQSELQVKFFPFEAYLYLSPFWMGWPAMFVLGLGARAIERSSTKLLIRILAFALSAYFILIFIQFAVPPNYDLMSGVPDAETGMCMQSTRFTCGACSAVMLLNKYGIYSTESEMARLTDTRKIFGVSDFALWVGLKRKLEGKPFKVSILKLDYDELVALKKPCVVSTEFSMMLNHAVCVCSAGPESVVVGDPLFKKPCTWSKEEFIEKWSGFAVVIEKTGE